MNLNAHQANVVMIFVRCAFVSIIFNLIIRNGIILKAKHVSGLKKIKINAKNLAKNIKILDKQQTKLVVFAEIHNLIKKKLKYFNKIIKIKLFL